MEAREASETEKRMSSVITFPDQTSALIACSISSVSLVTSFFDTIWFGRGRVLSGVLSDLLCPHHVLIFQQHQHWIRRICRPNINDVSSYEEWRRCIFNRVHRAAQIHRPPTALWQRILDTSLRNPYVSHPNHPNATPHPQLILCIFVDVLRARHRQIE